MNRHSVFVGIARLQIDFVAAYPATIGVFELGRMHSSPSLDLGLETLVNVFLVVHDCLHTRLKSLLPKQPKDIVAEAIRFSLFLMVLTVLMQTVFPDFEGNKHLRDWKPQ